MESMKREHDLIQDYVNKIKDMIKSYRMEESNKYVLEEIYYCVMSIITKDNSSHHTSLDYVLRNSDLDSDEIKYSKLFYKQLYNMLKEENETVLLYISFELFPTEEFDRRIYECFDICGACKT